MEYRLSLTPRLMALGALASVALMALLFALGFVLGQRTDRASGAPEAAAIAAGDAEAVPASAEPAGAAGSAGPAAATTAAAEPAAATETP